MLADERAVLLVQPARAITRGARLDCEAAGKDVFVGFNNDRDGNALRNGVELRQLLI